MVELTTHADPRPQRVERLAEQPEQCRPALERDEHVPVELELVFACSLEELGRAAEEQALFRLHDVGEHGCQRREKTTFPGGEARFLERAAHCVRAQAEAGEPLVQILAAPLRQAAVDLVLERNHAFRDASGRRDHDRHNGAGIEQQDFDVLHRRRLELRRRHEREHVGRARQHLAGRLECGIDLALKLGQVERERVRACLLPRQELVGVQPVRALRRHTAGRRVWMCEQPPRLELGELVSDGGRGHAQAGPLDEIARADRLAGGDVLLDHECEQVALAGSQADCRIRGHLQAV